jgi:uncharacterized ion transporter superfamily protein YfcC
MARKTKSKKKIKKEKLEVRINTVFGSIVLVAFAVLLVLAFYVIERGWYKKEVTELPLSEEEPEIVPVLDERDMQKTAELNYLVSVIREYYADNKQYPEALSDLEPDYLTDLSEVIEALEEVNYSASEDEQDYKITVKLGESGRVLMENDGGGNDNLYEVGTDLELE